MPLKVYKSAGAFPATERRSPSRFFVLVGALLCVWRGFRSLGGSPLIPDDASRSKVKTTLLARGSGATEKPRAISDGHKEDPKT